MLYAPSSREHIDDKTTKIFTQVTGEELHEEEIYADIRINIDFTAEIIWG